MQYVHTFCSHKRKINGKCCIREDYNSRDYRVSGFIILLIPMGKMLVNFESFMAIAIGYV